MRYRHAFVSLIGSCVLWVSGAPLFAQLPTPNAPPASANQNDSAYKDQILRSPEWHEVLRELDEWYSAQKLYDPMQVRDLKREMDNKVAAMSAAQLADFFADLRQKVVILNGREARDAQKWLGETLAVASPAYAKKTLARMPDVAHLTAAQLQEQLDEFEDRTAQTARSSATFEKQRDERFRVVQRQEQQAESERERALDRAATDAAYGNAGNNYSNQRRFPVYPGTTGFSFGYPIFYGGYRW